MRGTKICGEVSGRKYQRTNIIAGYCNGKVLAPFQYSGTTDAALVEDWLEIYLLPKVSKGSTIVFDNASFHKKATLPEIAENAECFTMFTPKYSPDLNKIETSVWANLKNHLRNYMTKFESLSLAIVDYFQFT